MRIATVLIAACALLAGCATQKMVWVKAGSTEQEFYADQGQCKAQAFSVPGMMPMQVAIVFNSCMQGRGWSSEPQR